MGQQHITQSAHKPQLCKSWAISVKRGGGNKCWVQLRLTVCALWCVFLDQSRCWCNMSAMTSSPLLLSAEWIPTNVKGSQEKGEWGRETRGVGENGVGYQCLQGQGWAIKKERSYKQWKEEKMDKKRNGPERLGWKQKEAQGKDKGGRAAQRFRRRTDSETRRSNIEWR